MNLEKKYEQLMTDLKSGKRGRTSLSSEDFLTIKHMLDEDNLIASKLKMILCLLAHSDKRTKILDTLLLNYIKKIKQTDNLVMAINCFSHMVLQRKVKDGERLTSAEVEVLKNLLKNKDLEIVEWSLRTIEELGVQSKIFKKEIQNWSPQSKFINPFNSRYKNVKLLIKYINQRS